MRILLSLLLFVSLGVAANPVYSGRMVDVNGNGLEGATYKITNTQTKAVIEVKTDTNGYYRVELPSGGTYKIEFSAPGYVTRGGITTAEDDTVSEGNEIVMQRDDQANASQQNHRTFKVSGRVTSAGSAVEFASVRFLKPDSSFVAGGATDGEGRFAVSLPAAGNYIMLASAMGYAPSTADVKTDGRDTELPEVNLVAEGRTLDEVTVKGRNMTRVNNHLQIIPDKVQLKHANSGYQLLNNIMIPGMLVDPFTGSVSLFGRPVSLYINGEPAEYRMVQNLRPKEVEKIEYHDAPVGRYAMDFAAINFVTKRRETGGYVNLDAQQSIGGYMSGAYNGFAKVNKGNTSLYAFAGYSVQNAAADVVEKKESFNLQSRSLSREFNSIGGRDRSYNEYGQLTMQHIGNGNYHSLTAGLVNNHSVGTTGGRTVYSEPIDLTQTTGTRSNSDGLSPKLSYYGRFKTRGNDMLIASLNASYAKNSYDYLYSADGSEVISDTREKLYSVNASLQYMLDFKHRNSLTIVLMDIFRVTSTDYAGTYASWQHMWNSEALLLAEYTHKVSDKFRLLARPGISMVNIGLHGHKQQNFIFPRFYSQLTYSPSRTQQLNFSVAVGNSSVNLSNRTAAETPIDLIMSRRGNPSLKDVKLYESNLSYNGQFGRVNLSTFLEGKYYPGSLTAGYLPEGDRLIQTVYNGDYKSAKISPVATVKVTDSFRIQAGGSLCHENWSNRMQSQHLNFATGMVSLMYFWRDFSASLRGNTTSHSLNSKFESGFIPANLQLSLAWTHGSWRVDAWTRTSSRQSQRRWINSAAYRMDQTWHGRFYGMVKVAYTFDFGRKVQREHREANTSISSEILK